LGQNLRLTDLGSIVLEYKSRPFKEVLYGIWTGSSWFFSKGLPFIQQTWRIERQELSFGSEMGGLRGIWVWINTY
jgi:hypothetical protein